MLNGGKGAEEGIYVGAISLHVPYFHEVFINNEVNI